MKKLTEYEQLKLKVDISLTLTKKENIVVCQAESQEFVLPESVSKDLDFKGRDQLKGLMSSDCTFHIKLNKKKNYEVIKDDNDYGMMVNKTTWAVDEKEIPDFSSDTGFYALNSGDPIFSAIHDHLDKELAAGKLDDLITRNDGEPWTLAEAKIALEIYLKAKDYEDKDRMEMVKEYIREGKLHRSFHSVKMMVHGMCYFDEDSENHGLNHMGKIFKEVWDNHQDEVLTKIKNETK